MRDLRVLVLGLGAEPESFVLRTLEGLAQGGALVTVASRRPPAGAAPAGIEWLLDPRADPADVFATLRSRSGGLRQIGRLRPGTDFESGSIGVRFDVIYLPWINVAVERPGLFDFGVPVAVSCRGSFLAVAPWNPRRRALREAMPDAFGRAAAVHCVSASMEREAVALGLQPGKASVIYTGVDVGRYRPAAARSESADGLRVLWVGGLNWKKDIEHALLAIEGLARSGRHCTISIVGTGPESDRAEFTRHDLGLDSSVWLLGHVGQGDLPALYQAHDVLLHSSSTEGVPNVVVEAMASGLPVVATDSGGTAEAVTDGVEGFLVPVRATAQMADRLATLSDDAALRGEMGRAGRRRAVGQFDLRHHVSGFRAFLEEAAGGGPAHR